jgi:hypothetical protein
MTRLIFVNKSGQNIDNKYVVGSGIGQKNRFSKMALKRRASNSSDGTCCVSHKINNTISGSVIDGYIKDADIKVISLSGKTIENTKSNSLGNYTLKTKIDDITELFKIEITNGIDITTNKPNKLKLEAIFNKSKKRDINKFNVTLISTMVSHVFANNTQISNNINRLEDAKDKIVKSLDITKDEINLDFIEEENNKITKKNANITNTLNIFTKLIPESDISVNKLFKDVTEFIKTKDKIDFSNNITINNLVEKIKTENPLITINDTKRNNISSLVSETNKNLLDVNENYSYEHMFEKMYKLQLGTDDYIIDNKSDVDLSSFENISNTIKQKVETENYAVFKIKKQNNIISNIRFECLTPNSYLNIIDLGSDGKKYSFNNNIKYNPYLKYALGKGTYHIYDIPENHKLAILNKDVTNKITYHGDTLKRTSKEIENIGTYYFYYGKITIKVDDDFDKVSIYCLNDGYMGGENLFVYNNSCQQYTILPIIDDDFIPPTILLNGNENITLKLKENYSEKGAVIMDNGEKIGSASIEGFVDTQTPGVYKLTYRGKDYAGNVATELTRTVTVEAPPPPSDETAPVITLIGQATISIAHGSTYTDQGASTDDGSDIVTTINGPNGETSIDTSISGIYTISYNSTDSNGNVATEVTRTVIVEAAPPPPDETAPVITLIGQATISIAHGSTYTDQGASTDDGSDIVTTINGPNGETSIDTSISGIYTISYNSTDSNGNVASEVTRTVTVEAASPPDEIHLYVNGGQLGSPYYRFYTDEAGTQELSPSNTLNLNKKYIFHRLNSATTTSHPFYISDNGYENLASDKISLSGDGSASSGIVLNQSFTLVFNSNYIISENVLNYYCTAHSIMIGIFNVVDNSE